MKIALFVTAFIIASSVSAKAEGIENMSCSQLRKLQQEIKISHQSLYCDSQKTGDSEELIELSEKMIFQTNRLTKVIGTMRIKDCSVAPTPKMECSSEASRKQVCERALDVNDYDTYKKYCL